MTTPRFLFTQLIKATLLSLCAATVGGAAITKFDIPTQPAPAALALFTKQSGVQVVFDAAELKPVRTNAVVGDFETGEALTRLLQNTGFASEPSLGGVFAVVKDPAAATGTVRGVVVKPDLGSSEGIRILLRETGQMTVTDRRGDFVFSNVSAGTYTLIATAEGLQPMHITEVRVRAGRELTLSRESMRKAGTVTELEPFIVRGRADEVTELDKYIVEGRKQKPFVSGNVDMPRTVNDVQPYYVFDAQTIDRAAALNVEDFLKQRLTMNTVDQTGMETVSSGIGVNSAINLRGLGANKTLILVNGRRLATRSATTQTDVNGIPLSVIERIEVMPSSSSGIYGGSAVGGVINIILKQNYSGGEIRATYDNTWDTDSPRRSLSFTWGQTLEDGKTRVMLTGTASDSQPLWFQDRLGLRQRWQDTLLTNDPAYYDTNSSAPLAATPNIRASSTLVLLDGRSLGSNRTHISAGLSPTAGMAELSEDLLRNAGSYNLEFPDSAQWGGLRQRFGANPKSQAIQASVRRQMLPRVELFADFSYSDHSAEAEYNPFGNLSTSVPVGAPGNPFRQAISIRLPNPTVATQHSDSISRTLTIGGIVQLPGDWVAELDYTRSDYRNRTQSTTYDSTALRDDIVNGVINVLSDTLLYPYSTDAYFVPQVSESSSESDEFSLRTFGSLPELPWGTPTLTVIAQRRVMRFPDLVSATLYPRTTASSTITTTFAREQISDSIAAESMVPLIAKDKWPFLYSLDVQLAGRLDRYEVDTGTPNSTYRPDTGVTTYGTPNINGQPFESRTSYDSRNGTIGLRYQPIESVTMRTSIATAFSPPTAAQLLRNPERSLTPTAVDDPVTGSRYEVFTVGGGNPDLKPESSESWNAGVIWQPRGRLDGIRLNVEYYKIKQLDRISTLSAQQILDSGDIYANRVTRDPSGRIEEIDISSVNLFKYETDGFDFSADFTTNSPAGVFRLRAGHTFVLHEKRQLAFNGPNLDYAGFDGAPIEHKGNASIDWERRGWSAGWTTVYYGSYKINGAPGGPTAVNPTNILRQGGDSVPTQVYHDAHLGYRFDKRDSAAPGLRKKITNGLLSDLSVQVGLKNVFNTWPAYHYSSYQSHYIGVRLRSYWISVRKQF